MKRLLPLAFLAISTLASAQYQYYSLFSFSDSAYANFPLTLTVEGYWDSTATTQSGPYSQVISTSTLWYGGTEDTVQVPANVLSVRSKYTYVNCLGNTVSVYSANNASPNSGLSVSGVYCPPVVCNYTAYTWLDSTNLSGLSIQGRINGAAIANTTFSWDMGDGTTYNTRNVLHTYAQAGSYTVITHVVVRDQNNVIQCADSDTLLTHVPNTFCNGTFNVSNGSGLGISVSGQQTFGGWEYTLSDGAFYTTQQFSHTFASPGTYTIVGENYVVNPQTGLRICADSSTRTVTVNYPTYSLWGRVHNVPLGDSIEVYLISSVYDSVAGSSVLSLEQSIRVADSAYYQFSGLLSGTYFVKAAAHSSSSSYGSLLPTYFGDVLQWSNATPIQVSSNTFMNDINLISGVNPGGPGFIGGLVIQGANKTMAAGKWDVLLTTDQDVPVAHQQTDVNDQYGFSNLAYGTYKVYVEIAGSNIVPHLVTLSAGSDNFPNISFEADSVLSAPLSLSRGAQLLRFDVFPNPAREKVQVVVNTASKEAVSVSLFTVDGVELRTSATTSGGAGVQQVSIALDGLSKGMYLLRVKQGEATNFSKLQKL